MEERDKNQEKNIEETAPRGAVEEVQAYRAEAELKMREMAGRMASDKMKARMSIS